MPLDPPRGERLWIWQSIYWSCFSKILYPPQRGKQYWCSYISFPGGGQRLIQPKFWNQTMRWQSVSKTNTFQVAKRSKAKQSKAVIVSGKATIYILERSLYRQDLDHAFAPHNCSFPTKKNLLATRVKESARNAKCGTLQEGKHLSLCAWDILTSSSQDVQVLVQI